jgi:hypothetical protein
MDGIDVGDAASLVRELRAAGLAESTIQGVLVAAGRTFKFARRHMGSSAESPIALLENGERPRLADTPERRIYEPHELAQVLASSWEPWRTLFRLANVAAARESELLGLWWQDLDLRDLDAATIAFTHQVDRRGVRVLLKTEESRAVLPLPRSAALMMLEHKARSLHTGLRSFVRGPLLARQRPAAPILLPWARGAVYRPSTATMWSVAAPSRSRLASWYSGESYQRFAASRSSNSSSTNRFGRQSPSSTATSPPRTMKRPPPAAMASGEAAL